MSSTPRGRSGKVAAASVVACLLAVLAARAVAAQPLRPVPEVAAVRTTTTTTRSEGDVAVTEPTTVPPSTAPTTTAPPTTAVPSTTVATALKDRASDSEEATTRLNRAVIGLLALAALITVVTVVFWRMTRPDRTPRSKRSSAHWVDDEGGELPLPDDPSAADMVADPAAWSVGAPVVAIPTPRLDPSPGGAPADGGEHEAVAPVTRARTRSSAATTADVDRHEDTGPVVVVESVDPARTAPPDGADAPRRRSADRAGATEEGPGPDPDRGDGSAVGWASQGWGGGADDPGAR